MFFCVCINFQLVNVSATCIISPVRRLSFIVIAVDTLSADEKHGLILITRRYKKIILIYNLMKE